MRKYVLSVAAVLMMGITEMDDGLYLRASISRSNGDRDHFRRWPVASVGDAASNMRWSG